MANVITVVSGKGGVGKSTFCVNIASALASLKQSVLLIDGDAGLRCLDLLLGVDEMVVYDWLDIIENRCNREKALLFCENNIKLLPAPLILSENMTENDFKSLVSMYKDDYDFIIIDSPAGTGSLTNIYTSVCDSAVIIATPDSVSARSAFVMGDCLIRSGIKEETVRLVINRFDKKAVKKGKLLNIDDVIDSTYLRLLGVVPENRNLMYTSVSSDENYKYSETKYAFSRIAKRILGYDVQISL